MDPLDVNFVLVEIDDLAALFACAVELDSKNLPDADAILRRERRLRDQKPAEEVEDAPVVQRPRRQRGKEAAPEQPDSGAELKKSDDEASKPKGAGAQEVETKQPVEEISLVSVVKKKIQILRKETCIKRSGMPTALHCQNWWGAGWLPHQGENKAKLSFVEAFGILPCLPGGANADDE